MVKKPVIVLFALAALGSGAVACGPGPTATPTLRALPTLTPTPLSLQAPGWEEVTLHTLCLEVEQSYPRTYSEIEAESYVPIAGAAEGILSRLGLEVAGEGIPCDATLTLVLNGEAIGANYSGGRYCYSGAKVTGEMVLTFPERVPLTLPIGSTYSPPFSIRWCPEKPRGAPFDRAGLEALLGGLAHLWGPQALIRALGDEKQDVRDVAVEALVDMGPEAVPDLIQALGDEKWTVGSLALEALNEITGQDFGRDAAAWQEWWEAQQ